MRVLCAIAMVSCALALAGCGGTPVMTSTERQPAGVQGAAIHGRVHGGQQPIVGASVYLYAAATNGYGQPSKSLLTSAGNTTKDGNGNYYVTTDSNGNFSITGDYTCPSTTSQVYLYSVGGNAGAGNNPGAGLLAALGPCPASGTLSSSLYVVMNEVSTIATAYAIAGYAVDATHVSSSGSALATTGIANAFASVENLETLGTGVALATTPQGNGAVPQSEINTLANILAACVNTNGSVLAGTPCSGVLDVYETDAGITAVTDTASAAIVIAHYPWVDFPNFFGLQTGGAPFQPSLSTAPNDFTIAISYTGSGIYGPAGMAVDASGNIWVADFHSNGLSKLGPTGAPLSGTGGFSGGGLDGPAYVAIDSSGNAWVTNYEGSSISKFSSSGSVAAGSPYTLGGLSSPWGIAIDQSGHVWAADQGNNSISEFSSSGSPITSSSGITTGGLDYPLGIAIDISGDVWVANGHAYSLSEFNSSGTANTNSPFTGGGLIAPLGVAVDSAGNVWASNIYSGANSLSKLNSSGSPLSPASTGYTGGGLDEPYAVAIDGAGNVWAPNYSGNTISEFTSSGTQICAPFDDIIPCPNGYTGGGLSEPADIAIDGSGNVWVTNYGSYNGTNITEFVGAAAPVVTPIVANLKAPYGAHAVNLP